MATVEVVAEFSGDDYARGYVCAASEKRCSPNITVRNGGVWFRTEPAGMLMSAHRGCLPA
ncbi:hypothetical protein [Mycolicibacterium sp.]|uniref:hypothetical protein n=1 Tax=Mycolicibacterium sp. TaxID=2320850 RepID=UPI00355F346C